MSKGRKNAAFSQMLLDFGQKEFGTRVCKDCHMIYTIGDPDDFNAHSRFHSRYVNPDIKVSRWKNQQVLEECFDGSRIIEISGTDKVGMAMYAKLSTFMDRDLGHDRPSDLSAKRTTIEFAPYVRIFVFVEGMKKTAVGCCVAEELTGTSVRERRYLLRRLVGGRQSLLSWQVQNAVPSDPPVQSDTSPTVSLPLCGIRRLWIAATHRRKGVASSLLDCVLKNLIYLTHLSRQQVAFAEPTSNGADFATYFTGRDDFIIY